MTIWIDLLISFSPWIFLLGEVYLGKRVYDATRRRLLLHQKVAQLRLLASPLRQSHQRTHTSNSASQASHTSAEDLALLLMFREQLPAMPSLTWERLATFTVVASVFVLAFLGMSILLRPVVNRALFDVLPLCLPLAIIPLPYLFSMKPRATLLLLAAALGLSFLALVLMGV